MKGSETQNNAENKEHTTTETNEQSASAETVNPETSARQNGEAMNSETVSSDKASQESRASDEKLAEMQDRYLRLSAEFDNYRKRTLKEKMDLSKYASENLLIKLLPVMDDFERALTHMDSSADSGAIKQGIDLIYNKFGEFLRQNGVKEVESMNSPFNVDVHDAVAKFPVAEEDRKGKIVDVIQKGYFLHDKVIRHAKVVVGE